MTAHHSKTAPPLGECLGCGHGFDCEAWDDRHCLDHPDADQLNADVGDYHSDCCPLCTGPESDAPSADRFDVAALAATVGATTAQRLAIIAGVSVRTVWRWRANGLTTLQADRAAVACGLHPGLVWPTWWQLPTAA